LLDQRTLLSSSYTAGTGVSFVTLKASLDSVPHDVDIYENGS
jgi:hypothetical protein